MALIKLDAAELKSQAAEMDSLGSDYEQLFADVSGTLQQLNNNWSANLANNFADKITNAQKSFSSVVDMLKFGANAANSSAISFSSIDEQLSKAFGGNGGNTPTNHVSAIWENAVDIGSSVVAPEDVIQDGESVSVIDVQEDISENRQEAAKRLKEVYELLPDWVKEVIGTEEVELILDYMSEDSESLYTLDVNSDIIKNTILLSSGGKAKAESYIISTAYDLALHPTGKFAELRRGVDLYEDLAQDAFEAGDYGEGVKNFALYLGTGMFTMGYGVFEGMSEAAISYAEDTSDIVFSALDTIAFFVPSDIDNKVVDVTKSVFDGFWDYMRDIY